MRRRGRGNKFIFFLVIGVAITSLARFAFVRPTTATRASAPAAEKRQDLPAVASALIKPPTQEGTTQPTASAKAMVVYDVNSSYPLYEKNADEPVPIASTTKLMTAAVVLEHYDLDDIVTVSKEAATINGSEIYLVTGERIRVRDLLKGLLIQSGNDTAAALAEHKGKEQFVNWMNEMAATLGMLNTRYKDPAGLDDEGRSTARDLAIVATYDIRNPVIQEIVRMQRATITSVDGEQVHELVNSNRLIDPENPLYYQYATGLKTGFTPDAGHCLVASAEKNNHTIVSVVLGTTENSAEASAKESRKLLTWTFENFSWE